MYYIFIDVVATVDVPAEPVLVVVKDDDKLELDLELDLEEGNRPDDEEDDRHKEDDGHEEDDRQEEDDRHEEDFVSWYHHEYN